MDIAAMEKITALSLRDNGALDLDVTKAMVPQLTQGVTWIHFEGTLAEASDFLSREFKLSHLVLSTLCDEYTRPRNLMDENDDLLVTMRTIATEGEYGNHLASLRCWVTESLIITVAKAPLGVVSELSKRYRKKAKGVRHGHHVLWELGRLAVDQIASFISNLDDAIDVLEDSWEEKHTVDTDKLHQLRLDVSHLRRYLLPQLDAFLKIGSVVYEFYSDDKEKALYLMRWKELANAIKRDLETTTDMRERIVTLKDALQQKTNEMTNKIMFLLSIVATFFLPLTFIASLLGMNVKGIPAAEYDSGFWIVSLLMLGIALIQLVLFKRWKWLK